jgi:hypothetical protein
MDLNSQKSRFLEITISNPVWTHLKDRLAFGRSQIGFFEDPNFLSHTVMNVAPDDIFEPQTHQEAISCPESAKWISAMEEVMESLRLNETWQLQPLPEGRRQIRNNLADLCVYRRSEEDRIVILAIWVNDGLLCGPDKTKLLEPKNNLRIS